MASDHLSDDVPASINRLPHAGIPPQLGKTPVTVPTTGRPVLRIVNGSRDAVRNVDHSVPLSAMGDDVESSIAYCKKLMVDLAPVFDLLGEQNTPADFFLLLREYLYTLEIAVFARSPIDNGGKNVHVLQRNPILRFSAEAYADTVDPVKRAFTIENLKKIRQFAESRLPR